MNYETEHNVSTQPAPLIKGGTAKILESQFKFTSLQEGTILG